MATSTLYAPGSAFNGNAFTMHEIKAVQPDTIRIPLVGHIITDEDIGALQGAKHLPVNLAKVIKLLTDEHSAMLFDRHLHALKKVCKHYKDGFVMKELVSVFKVLNICADRVDDHPLYIQPMVDMLVICSLPFLKEKSSDELAYEQIAIESIAQLGYLMRVPSNEVRLQICETLITFYCETPPPQIVQRHKANSLEYNQKIVEKSDLTETLVKSMALLENDVTVKISVLKVLQKLSKNSVGNCDMMLRADGAERMCSRLMDYDPSGQVLFRSVDILWNLLEHSAKDQVTQQLCNLSCISQLRDAFIHQLTAGYSHYDRQLRNDLLVISSLIAQDAVHAPFVESQFVRQLVLFATFQEVKSHNALVKHLKLMTNHEDFEMKKLLINIIVLLSADPGVIPILCDGKLLLALFSYVKANEKVSAPQEWTVAQFEEIQLHAMAALCTLGPLMIEDYMTCQGSTRLLLLLEWCVGPDDYLGTGNSFHGAGGCDNKKAQMRYCLRLIRSMVSTGEDQILSDFTDQGAINQIISILSKITQNRKPIENTVDIEMQGDMLFILSALCENDVHRKELYGNEGVDVVSEYLKTDIKQLTSGLGHHRLLLAAVDCVWCCVVGCYTTEDYFLEKEGVFLLIDLLEKCPKNMHNLILGCLLDLCENPKTIAHVTVWRGAGDISAPHLLCEVWRKEEVDIGVCRTQHGAMQDAKKPLMGQYQENSGTISLPSSHPSQAIVDVSENMRAKIYALFCKVGFIELPGLTTDDHVTLTIIEHYLDFKLGEVWTEVASELEVEEIRPITPDREALEAISRTIEDRADHVGSVQRELRDAQGQQDLIDEQEHYSEIRENHRQKEKALKDFSDYVARTSNYILLKAAKERQELSIDASRVANNYKQSDTYHGTDLPNLNATLPMLVNSTDEYNAESLHMCTIIPDNTPVNSIPHLVLSSDTDKAEPVCESSMRERYSFLDIVIPDNSVMTTIRSQHSNRSPGNYKGYNRPKRPSLTANSDYYSVLGEDDEVINTVKFSTFDAYVAPYKNFSSRFGSIGGSHHVNNYVGNVIIDECANSIYDDETEQIMDDTTSHHRHKGTPYLSKSKLLVNDFFPPSRNSSREYDLLVNDNSIYNQSSTTNTSNRAQQGSCCSSASKQTTERGGSSSLCEKGFCSCCNSDMSSVDSVDLDLYPSSISVPICVDYDLRPDDHTEHTTYDKRNISTNNNTLVDNRNYISTNNRLIFSTNNNNCLESCHVEDNEKEFIQVQRVFCIRFFGHFDHDLYDNRNISTNNNNNNLFDEDIMVTGINRPRIVFSNDGENHSLSSEVSGEAISSQSSTSIDSLASVFTHDVPVSKLDGIANTSLDVTVTYQAEKHNDNIETIRHKDEVFSSMVSNFITKCSIVDDSRSFDFINVSNEADALLERESFVLHIDDTEPEILLDTSNSDIYNNQNNQAELYQTNKNISQVESSSKANDYDDRIQNCADSEMSKIGRDESTLVLSQFDVDNSTIYIAQDSNEQAIALGISTTEENDHYLDSSPLAQFEGICGLEAQKFMQDTVDMEQMNLDNVDQLQSYPVNPVPAQEAKNVQGMEENLCLEVTAHRSFMQDSNVLDHTAVNQRTVYSEDQEPEEGIQYLVEENFLHTQLDPDLHQPLGPNRYDVRLSGRDDIGGSGDAAQQQLRNAVLYHNLGPAHTCRFHHHNSNIQVVQQGGFYVRSNDSAEIEDMDSESIEDYEIEEDNNEDFFPRIVVYENMDEIDDSAENLVKNEVMRWEETGNEHEGCGADDECCDNNQTLEFEGVNNDDCNDTNHVLESDDDENDIDYSDNANVCVNHNTCWSNSTLNYHDNTEDNVQNYQYKNHKNNENYEVEEIGSVIDERNQSYVSRNGETGSEDDIEMIEEELEFPQEDSLDKMVINYVEGTIVWDPVPTMKVIRPGYGKHSLNQQTKQKAASNEVQNGSRKLYSDNDSGRVDFNEATTSSNIYAAANDFQIRSYNYMRKLVHRRSHQARYGCYIYAPAGKASVKRYRDLHAARSPEAGGCTGEVSRLFNTPCEEVEECIGQPQYLTNTGDDDDNTFSYLNSMDSSNNILQSSHTTKSYQPISKEKESKKRKEHCTEEKPEKCVKSIYKGRLEIIKGNSIRSAVMHSNPVEEVNSFLHDEHPSEDISIVPGRKNGRNYEYYQNKPSTSTKKCTKSKRLEHPHKPLRQFQLHGNSMDSHYKPGASNLYIKPGVANYNYIRKSTVVKLPKMSNSPRGCVITASKNIDVDNSCFYNCNNSNSYFMPKKCTENGNDNSNNNNNGSKKIGKKTRMFEDLDIESIEQDALICKGEERKAFKSLAALLGSKNRNTEGQINDKSNYDSGCTSDTLNGCSSRRNNEVEVLIVTPKFTKLGISHKGYSCVNNNEYGLQKAADKLSDLNPYLFRPIFHAEVARSNVPHANRREAFVDPDLVRISDVKIRTKYSDLEEGDFIRDSREQSFCNADSNGYSFNSRNLYDSITIPNAEQYDIPKQQYVDNSKQYDIPKHYAYNTRAMTRFTENRHDSYQTNVPQRVQTKYSDSAVNKISRMYHEQLFKEDFEKINFTENDVNSHAQLLLKAFKCNLREKGLPACKYDDDDALIDIGQGKTVSNDTYSAGKPIHKAQSWNNRWYKHVDDDVDLIGATKTYSDGSSGNLITYNGYCNANETCISVNNSKEHSFNKLGTSNKVCEVDDLIGNTPEPKLYTNERFDHKLDIDNTKYKYDDDVELIDVTPEPKLFNRGYTDDDDELIDVSPDTAFTEQRYNVDCESSEEQDTAVFVIKNSTGSDSDGLYRSQGHCQIKHLHPC